ncbi:MAG: hypothetical protein QG599_2539 [Pseudomonadota bacterium]|nr:hypothetical protein [Pseudomonadota bacterium]
MKTTLAAASFALITALSSLSTAHAAGFNDRSVVPNATVSSQTGQQDLRNIPVVQGFNQQSHIPATALQATRRTMDAPAVAGAHCDLNPRAGFQNSTSFASC